MEKFPKNKINPISGILSGIDGDVSLEIKLSPFELEFEEYSETVDSSIRLDGVSIPLNPKLLEGKKYRFPINPENGYIDGSVYFFGTHNPVDVTEIIFGSIDGRKLPVNLKTNWALEFENTGFENFSTQVATNIEL